MLRSDNLVSVGIMRRLIELQEQLNKLDDLIPEGEEQLRLKQKKTISEFLELLKPKVFRNDFIKHAVLSSTKTFKGYDSRELRAMCESLLKTDSRLKTLKCAVEEARSARFHLMKEINERAEVLEQNNKVFIDSSKVKIDYKEVKGSSMPNLPWEEIFESKFL